jgi:hypothetical protein
MDPNDQSPAEFAPLPALEADSKPECAPKTNAGNGLEKPKRPKKQGLPLFNCPNFRRHLSATSASIDSVGIGEERLPQPLRLFPSSPFSQNPFYPARALMHRCGHFLVVPARHDA